MDLDGIQEVVLYGKSAVPGYLYDTTSREFSPSKDAENIETEDMPLRFEFTCQDKMSLEKLQTNDAFKDDSWVRDLNRKKPVDAAMVKGVKTLEKRGIGVPLDSENHRLISLIFDRNVRLLMIFSQGLPKGSLNELEVYLLGVVGKAGQSFIPPIIKKNFKYAYIYQNHSDQGIKVTSVKYGLHEFCRLLTDLPFIEVPMTGLIKAPCKPGVVVSSDIHDVHVEDASSNSQDGLPQVHSNVNPNNVRCQKRDSPLDPNRIHKNDLSVLHCGKPDDNERSSNVPSCTYVAESEKDLYDQNFFFETTANSVSSVGNMNEVPSEKILNEEIGKSRMEINAQGPENSTVKNAEAVDQRSSQRDNYNCKSNLNQSMIGDESEKSNLTQGPQTENGLVSGEESPENLLKKDSNSKQGGEEQCSFGKDDMSKDHPEEIGEKHGSYVSTNFSPSKFINKDEENLLKNGKVDPEKECQTSQKNNHMTLKGSSVQNHEIQSGSASILKKQKRLCQVLGKDDTDEAPVLKDPAQAMPQTTKKQQLEKENQINLESTFLNPEYTMKDACGLERKYYGVINSQHPEKVILLLGASGSGKTMLINSVANYFMGKKTADDKLIHVENSTPTTAITAYTFCLSLDEIPITIIDTPGLNDSSGAEVRDHVKSLKTFLANFSSKGFKIHAIGFVAQAYLVRLTSSERLVMDYVSTLFGQIVSEHLITLVTFADNQDNPPVVEAMKNYGVKSKHFLKFNNSALTSTKSDQIDALDRVYWKICMRNWEMCLKTLRDMSALSVNTMKAVQKEIYATTVIESAENDLRAELTTFFNVCKNENCISKKALEICEQIWELGAIVRRLRYVQDSSRHTLHSVIIEFARNACKVLEVLPEKYVSILSLNLSGTLVASGVEIISAMAPYYESAKKWHSESTKISKSVTEWAYCHECRKEHKMGRCGPGKIKKMIGLSNNTLTLECVDCDCPGEVHELISKASPFHHTIYLQNTRRHLRDTLSRYSLPGYIVQEGIFLTFLDKHMFINHNELIKDLIKML